MKVRPRLVATCIASIVIGIIAKPLLSFMSTDHYGSTMLTILVITFMQVGCLLAELFPEGEN